MPYLALGGFLPFLFFYHPSFLIHSLFSSFSFSVSPISVFLYTDLPSILILHLFSGFSLFVSSCFSFISLIILFFYFSTLFLSHFLAFPYDSALTYTIRIYTCFVLSCTDYDIVISVFLLQSSSRPMHLSSRLKGSHLVYKRVFSFLDPPPKNPISFRVVITSPVSSMLHINFNFSKQNEYYYLYFFLIFLFYIFDDNNEMIFF